MKTLLVMGGDRRMEYVGERLADLFDVYTYGFPSSRPIWELKQADILVLPYLSLSGEYLNAPSISQKIPAVSCLDLLKYGGTLFGGGLEGHFLSYCAERNARIFDYFDDEELTLKNAHLTAEGTIGIILRETARSIGGSDILILGYGRVAKDCAETFSKLGAKTSIAARSQDARKSAEAAGFKAYDFIDEQALKSADVVINTVPQTVLDRPRLALLKKEALVIDLASKPYGTDFGSAAELGIKALTAPGLPGKTVPKTAGYFIAESIIKSLKEGERCG